MLILLLDIYARVDMSKVADVTDEHAAFVINVEVNRSFE
jgi:hypothetical protein